VAGFSRPALATGFQPVVCGHPQPLFLLLPPPAGFSRLSERAAWPPKKSRLEAGYPSPEEGMSLSPASTT